MATRFHTAANNLGNVLLPKLRNADDGAEVVYKENGKVKVYKRRWVILAAFCMGYFSWNFHTLKQTAIVAEYADYFDTTNEFAPQKGEVGVDFFNIVDSFLLVIFYPFAGQLVDKFGMKLMIYGSIGQALSAWWYYLSFRSLTSALLSRILSSMSGTLIASSFLRISTQWFPASERPFAVGIGVISSELGAGAALIAGTMFAEGDGEEILDLSLKSCKNSFKETVVDVTSTTCNDTALENFCCLVPTDINGLNLMMAIVTTVVAIFAVLVTREAPASPPSKAGKRREGPGFKQGVKLMFSHRNYNQICVADFIMTGPPQVLFAALSRLFPPSVEEYSFVAGAAGLGLAIPAAIVFALQLAKNQLYFDMTAWAYTAGGTFWFLATVALAIATDASEVFFLFVAAGALVTLILWSVSVYELKAEYVFDRVYNLEGFIVGVDRTIINLSGLIFLAAIPPERINSDKIPGRLFTFYAGLFFMILGVIIVWTTKDKRLYLRQKFEDDSASAIEDNDEAEEKNAKAILDDEIPETGPVAEEVEDSVVVDGDVKISI